MKTLRILRMLLAAAVVSVVSSFQPAVAANNYPVIFVHGFAGFGECEPEHAVVVIDCGECGRSCFSGKNAGKIERIRFVLRFARFIVHEGVATGARDECVAFM